MQPLATTASIAVAVETRTAIVLQRSTTAEAGADAASFTADELLMQLPSKSVTGFSCSGRY